MTADATARERALALPILAAAVVALSSAAILIRMSDAPALSTAFFRVLFSAAMLAPFALRDRTRGATVPWRQHAGFTVAAGAALGMHFFVWMRSLDLTSVASSTLFVTTTPIWVALASRWLPGEDPPTLKGWMGLGVSIVGGGVIIAGTAGPSAEGVTLAGIAYATLGAWLAAAYLIASRGLRHHVPLGTLTFRTNVVAALTLGLLVLLTGAPVLGWDATTWGVLLAMAALPQLVGHNALIWGLKYFGATVIALVVLLEPIGASLLAAVCFSEFPCLWEWIGGGLLLAGLALAVPSANDDASADPASHCST